MCRAPKYIAIELADNGIIRLAQARGVFGHSIQYRLDLRRRTGDHAQNLARRRLLLQRLLEFVEQPHVLDCDDGLVGESFEQLDLRRIERTHLATTRVQHSNKLPLLAERSRQQGTIAAGGTQGWKFVLPTDVGNVKRA